MSKKRDLVTMVAALLFAASCRCGEQVRRRAVFFRSGFTVAVVRHLLLEVRIVWRPVYCGLGMQRCARWDWTGRACG